MKPRTRFNTVASSKPEKKKNSFSFRVTTDEGEKLALLSSEMGITIAQFCREILVGRIEAPKKSSRKPYEDKKEDQENRIHNITVPMNQRERELTNERTVKSGFSHPSKYLRFVLSQLEAGK